MKLAFHEVRFCSWHHLLFWDSEGQKIRKTCFFAVRARFFELLSRVFACFLHFQRANKYAKRAFLQCARAFGSFFHVFLHAFCIFHNPKQPKFAYPTVRARLWEAKLHTLQCARSLGFTRPRRGAFRQLRFMCFCMFFAFFITPNMRNLHTLQCARVLGRPNCIPCSARAPSDSPGLGAVHFGDPSEAKFAYLTVRARPWEAKFAHLTVRALPRL